MIQVCTLSWCYQACSFVRLVQQLKLNMLLCKTHVLQHFDRIQPLSQMLDLVLGLNWVAMSRTLLNMHLMNKPSLYELIQFVPISA